MIHRPTAVYADSLLMYSTSAAHTTSRGRRNTRIGTDANMSGHIIQILPCSATDTLHPPRRDVGAYTSIVTVRAAVSHSFFFNQRVNRGLEG
ncbi:hypothetical protein BCIN_01g04650 [Botrytis cinerea B05.10]|uniref:Uncharacterized protein n=2 Tax=Botryotinia fuckeliana TaxID=40559 RepID=A0A384J5A7_BOTFB|nr:hypothetical protein BCIN_01g04650 [Botrytis cinerea B05.10]ATZ45741.1 hypothetical protein BCIN_01g04650 [Botrytis cinerea B05.10]CCD45387.1 hypothetical protein BofuT4_uP044050.1 [Botrytis cinerea T4]